MDKIAIYAGSFDPFTKGHQNVIDRGLRVFDKIIVALAHNVSKKTIFSFDDRIEIIKEIYKDRDNIVVDSFEGLLVDYSKKIGTSVLLRGMRSVSDFEYELQMALANKTLYSEIETIFIVTDSKYSHISSSLIREIVSLGGSVKKMVPGVVERRLKEKQKQKKR
ncbi:MAG: pantetheine-phosphate adenylyltransferase [Deltaproteobacteria bacterium]|nr:pantetheine-phosphate adenylyltransferase [Candidatus Dadabacteria bacterium]TDJ07412.1 MAG: pantetheine-phosphate adenylyltransferase [Deltaproteobacteria bacterium]